MIKKDKDDIAGLKDFLKRSVKKREEEYSRYKELSGLKTTVKIKIDDFISDNHFHKLHYNLKWWQWYKKLMRRLKKEVYVQVCVHTLNNIDVIKYFPMQGYIVTINKMKYLFSPENFRYINGKPILYFMYQNPYAVLINPLKNYYEPTITAEAMATVLDSKFVQDSLKSEEPKGNWSTAILIAIIFINIILSVVSLVMVSNVEKLLK